MRYSILGSLALAASALAIPNLPTLPRATAANAPKPDADGKYTITGDGVRAKFIAYGAAISNLYVKSKAGIELDVILGFDNASYYEKDTLHPFLGGVVGRYANRIKNSTFEIEGKKYNILPNDNPTKDHPKGVDTLHGGPKGYDWRNWTVVRHTKSSITFSLVDPDGEQGFPGEVISYVTYSLKGMTWDIQMVSIPTTKVTPIMLSSHAYWNLDGFMNKKSSTALDHTLWMPYAGHRVTTDSILIPTGDFSANLKGGVNDFWSKPKALGSSQNDPALHGNCGFNCTGYDTCYIFNRPPPTPISWQDDLVARLYSPNSGIQLDIFTDQDAFQVYNCPGQKGNLALKKNQGFQNDKSRPRVVQKYGCIVMEVQDYIDGINHPEWGRARKQIYTPGGDPFVLKAKYVFSAK